MSAVFLLASCPAPLARYTSTLRATTRSWIDIAPQETWLGSFHEWLTTPETVQTIANDLDISHTGYHTWSELIIDNLNATDKHLETDSGFTHALHTFNTTLDLDDMRAYEHIVTQAVANYFTSLATFVFDPVTEEGTVYKGEFITAEQNYGDTPSEIFRCVTVLSYLNFFTDAPVAEVKDRQIVGLYDTKKVFNYA